MTRETDARERSVSVTAPVTPHDPVRMLAFLDVVILVLAAPVMILIGVPAAGYGPAAVVWIALRAVGIGAERFATAQSDPGRAIGARLGYLLGRLFLLAIAVIVIRNASGRDAGLAALCVIVFAFTTELIISIATRQSPGSSR